MADKLVIVESPAKANTIKKFLGGSTKVVASMGHIRDLPKSKMGIDIEHDFEPEYINIRGKGDLIKSLKKEAKQAKKIYIAFCTAPFVISLKVTLVILLFSSFNIIAYSIKSFEISNSDSSSITLAILNNGFQISFSLAEISFILLIFFELYIS